MGNTVEQWRSSIGRKAGLSCIHDLGFTHTRTTKFYAVLVLFLLVACGSVESNPGPHSFTNDVERQTFNRIRSMDSKLAKYESHVEFYDRCIQEECVPKGLNFKIAFSAMIPGTEDTMKDFVASSKLNMLAVLRDLYNKF